MQHFRIAAVLNFHKPEITIDLGLHRHVVIDLKFKLRCLVHGDEFAIQRWRLEAHRLWTIETCRALRQADFDIDGAGRWIAATRNNRHRIGRLANAQETLNPDVGSNAQLSLLPVHQP